VHGIIEKEFHLFVLVLKIKLMINGDSRGRMYSGDRGEILGPPEDKLLRKHSPRVFSLIKNES
jgi:hypothetical protein